MDTHQGSGKMAAEPQAVQEQRVSGGLGGAPTGIHPSALALIRCHYLSGLQFSQNFPVLLRCLFDR